MKNKEENIYDKLIVICEDENNYCVAWFDERGVRHSIAEAKTASMALQLKKAYCDGWYDATHREA